MLWSWDWKSITSTEYVVHYKIEYLVKYILCPAEAEIGKVSGAGDVDVPHPNQADATRSMLYFLYF